MKVFSNMFNENTINIFTDASVKTINNTMYSAPGCLIIGTEESKSMSIPRVLDEDVFIIKNSTNNNGEIFAIFLAVVKAIKYKDKKINIISDSIISVEGLRKWYIKWFNNARNEELYNSEGKKVRNQNIFKEIINLISYEQLNVKFIHCRGHVNDKKFEKASETFSRVNGFNDEIDPSILDEIFKYNDIIDKDTRKSFKRYVEGSFPANKVINNANTALFNYICDTQTLINYKRILKGEVI